MFKPSIYGHTHFLLQSQKGIFGPLPCIWSRVVPDDSRRNLRLRSISCICHENYRAPTREIQTQIMLHLASPSWWRLVMWKRARRIRHLNANMEFYIDKSFISLRKTMKIYKNIYGEFIEQWLYVDNASLQSKWNFFTEYRWIQFCTTTNDIFLSAILWHEPVTVVITFL